MTTSTKLNLIELYPALHDIDEQWSSDDVRRPLLDAPRLFGARPVRHPLFRHVSAELRSAVLAWPLVLFIGMTGVGKTYASRRLVRLVNRALGGPGRVPAVYLVAPTAQRTAFSWKAFWQRLLVELLDPLPDSKVSARERAQALREHGVASSRTTEAQYFEAVREHAAERGLTLLVIDEASALARSEKGQTLYDNIEVLRELADLDLFRIVLVSTGKILPHLKRSGVLGRRLGRVVFSRYPEVLAPHGGAINPTSQEFLDFSSAAITLMERLPQETRLEFDEQHFPKLFRGALGCVGLLSDWYVRSIMTCLVEGKSALEWRHFERAALEVDERGNMLEEDRAAAEELASLSDRRLSLSEDEMRALAGQRYVFGPGLVSAQQRTRMKGNGKSKLRAKGSAGGNRKGKRVGVPAPHRAPVVP